MKHVPDPQRIELPDKAMSDLLRTKTPAQRVAMILDANRTMRLLIEGPLRERHPEWTDEQVRREVARRMLDGAG